MKPPRHPYLNLQQGNVESYCAIVPKKELPQWHAQGWLPHYAVGLSRRQLRLYGLRIHAFLAA